MNYCWEKNAFNLSWNTCLVFYRWISHKEDSIIARRHGCATTYMLNKQIRKSRKGCYTDTKTCFSRNTIKCCCRRVMLFSRYTSCLIFFQVIGWHPLNAHFPVTSTCYEALVFHLSWPWRSLLASLNFIRLLRVVITPSVTSESTGRLMPSSDVTTPWPLL